ncbi:MAG: DUF1513 domain-containing protein [Rhodocyclales bacterium]|nr:DUF1513 domain-containing protein [Rhodocyclales bacterium]
MNNAIGRRRFLLTLGALGIFPKTGLTLSPAGEAGLVTLIGAAWRGPNAGDTHYAGVLAADWERKQLEIRYAVPLPTRPHGLVPQADGGLLVNGVRPGTWLLRCDGGGKVMQQVKVEEESASVRLSGHIVVGRDVMYTTEIDYNNDRGRIGVRDRVSLKKLDEWDAGGIEPHQALLDEAGHLIVANGGVPRTLADKKYDLQRMDSSLVRLDGQNGRLLRQWKLDDPRLSLRHIAWSQAPVGGKTFLGVAMQAEHDDAARRAGAPILAVFDGEQLTTPTRANDGHGYAGDITAAYNGGFALSSNKAGVAQLWHPGAPDKLSAIVELDDAYALADWPGASRAGGVLVATAIGLVRWHPSAPPVLLPWPQPMALDNHWVRMA